MRTELDDGYHRGRGVGTVGVDRFETLLYGIGEAAGYLSIPPTTLRNWVYGYQRHDGGGRSSTANPVVTAVHPERRDGPSMPFIGLAEAYALEHALASSRLYTDGAEVLYDYAQHAADTPEGESAMDLVVVRNNQRVFKEVVDLYLRRIDFAPDGYAQLIRLPQYKVAEVTIDPDHAFGRPRFAHGGVGVENVIDLFRAGEPVDAVAGEFGLSRDEVEDAIRVATQPAA